MSVDYEELLHVLNLGVIVVDRRGKIIFWNRWMQRHTQLEAREVIGRRLKELFPEIEAKGFDWKLENVFSLGSYAFFSQPLYDHLLPMPPGRYFGAGFEKMPQSVLIAPLREASGKVSAAAVLIHDESDSVIYRRQLEATAQRLKEISQTDYLTRLPNRRHFLERLGEELARVQREAKVLCVAIADVDHFKQINDTYGHHCGDHVLVEMAEVLVGALRPYDTVGRVGGEEFGLLLPGADWPSAKAALERVRRRVERKRFVCPEAEISRTISIGFATTEALEAPTAEELLRRADAALYRAKALGRNQVVGWEPWED